MRWFTKINPRQLLWLAGGVSVQFEAVTRDLGVLATENASVIAEFETAIRQNRGGLSAITEAEFNELKKKANPSEISKRRWREEMSPRQGLVSSSHAEPAARAAVVEAAKPDSFAAGYRPSPMPKSES